MKNAISKILLSSAALAFLLPSVATADTQGPQPYAKEDGALVTLSGTVDDPLIETFLLEYDGGTILVDMDDFSSWGSALSLSDGQQVQVTGYIDEDFLEAKTIDASTVYVEGLNTHFYADPFDTEDASYYDSVSYDFDPGSISLTGTVTETRPFHDEMDVDFGFMGMQVDTDNLDYDLYDYTGLQKVSVGDRVRIYGELDNGIFERDEISASAVVKLSN